MTVADLYYGTKPSPRAESSTNGTEGVIYEYKIRGAADSTYSTSVPEQVGAYTLRATFPRKGHYTETTAVCDFLFIICQYRRIRAQFPERSEK